MAAEHGPGTLARVAALAIAAAALTWLGVVATRERAAANDARRLDEELARVLPGVRFDNRPATDRVLVTAPALLGSDAPLPAWRARLGGEPAAIVLTAIGRQGYVGPIEVRVGIARDGRVLAATVVAHSETPGVGDGIERGKSDWMDAFGGRSLVAPGREGWAVRPDGGEFDQLTGATVTSRAVVNAVRDALAFYDQEGAALFERPAQ